MNDEAPLIVLRSYGSFVRSLVVESVLTFILEEAADSGPCTVVKAEPGKANAVASAAVAKDLNFAPGKPSVCRLHSSLRECPSER